MSWDRELEELRRREAFAAQMGGAEKVAKHRAAGKLTVRERIAELLDAGSFHELGALAGTAQYDEAGTLAHVTPTNIVMGRGRIDARPVVVTGDDFTVRGGANDGGLIEKLMMPERMAHDLGVPLVRLVDGTGGGGSVRTIEKIGRTYIPSLPGWEFAIANLARVPVIGMALGSVAGLGSARVVSTHYSLMVKERSQLFVAGPPVVARLEKAYEKNELGGSHIHTRNGAVDDEVPSEEEAFARARRFLSYLPSNVSERPPRTRSWDDPQRRDQSLLAAVPRDGRQVYKMRPIVEAVVDQGSFFEMGRQWGRAVITGFARLDGWPVAVMASDPFLFAGAWDATAAQKVTRFVDLAQTFHLPIVHFVDIPGFKVGLAAEQEATIRHGARALAAIYQTSVPWASIIVRRAYGIAGAVHQPTGRYCMRLAWPSAQWGSLPIEGGLEAAYKAELEAAPDPKAKMAEIEARLRALTSPMRSAEAFIVEEIIDPRETRPLLTDWANRVGPQVAAGPSAFGLRP